MLFVPYLDFLPDPFFLSSLIPVALRYHRAYFPVGILSPFVEK